MGLFGGAKKSGGSFEFRVSDAVEVPRRGYLLRLKLLNGEPGLGDLAIGKRIRLRSPAGSERLVTIRDYSATQGPASQKRLDQTHELDVVIDSPDAAANGELVDVGWTASGPNAD